MSVSKHVYRAYLIGTPDVELSVTGGSISLQAGSGLHVTASIDVAFTTQAVLDALDPRNNVRVRVDVDARFPGGPQTRTFDLGLRDRTVNHRAGTVSLELASDEALLADFAPLADDRAPRALQSSLRSIIDYVLGVVIPGKTLAATPALDADMTAYWELTNMVLNPSGWPGTQGYSAASNTSSVDTRTGGYIGTTSVRWYATAAGGSFLACPRVAVTPGQVYYLSARVTNSVATNLRAQMRFLDPDGNEISRYESNALTATGGWDLLEGFFTAPPGAATMAPFMVHGATAAGQAAALDAMMIVESEEAVEYFQGGGMTLAGYTLAYDTGGSGDGYAQSIRTPIIERDPESTVWRAGQSAMDFLAPLVQAAGYRLVCDETRTWTLRDADYLAEGDLTVRHAVNLIDASDSISRDGDTWFDGAIVEYRWTDSNGIERRKIDSFALTATPTRVVKFERDTAFPGPGFAQYAVQRAQGRGHDVEVETVSNWTAHAEQTSEVVLTATPVQRGKTDSVTFDLGSDTMRVRIRTTDIAAGAIDLLSGTIDSLAGMINDL